MVHHPIARLHALVLVRGGRLVVRQKVGDEVVLADMEEHVLQRRVVQVRLAQHDAHTQNLGVEANRRARVDAEERRVRNSQGAHAGPLLMVDITATCRHDPPRLLESISEIDSRSFPVGGLACKSQTRLANATIQLSCVFRC